jgi:parallel beta-helix repeat protein
VNKRRSFSLIVCVGLCVAAVAALFLLAGDAARAQGATRYVATTGSDSGGCTDPGNPCATVQYAVDQAAGSDVIKVASGVYTGVQGRPVPPGYPYPPSGGVVTQVVLITKTVAVRGGYTAPAFADPPDPAANPTTLDAQKQGRVILMVGLISPTIEGLRITGGAARPGGGSSGGGAYVISATSTIRDNQILSNTAYFCGGLYLNYSDATLSGNTISGNDAGAYGGGGGLCLVGSDATLNGNTITGNSTSYLDSGDRLRLANSAPWQPAGGAPDGPGGLGGGLYVSNSDVMLNDNTITSNASVAGGGLYLESSSATLNDNTVTANNSGYYGGGLYLVYSSATLNRNIIGGNTTSNFPGGGLYLSYSSATLNGNTISSNSGSKGGGLYIGSSTATFNGNTISGNTSHNASGGGLHLYHSSATLSGNTISGNSAVYGGGLYLIFGSSATLVNDVVVDNQAGTSGSGLYVESASSARLLHTTLAGNQGEDGIVVTFDAYYPTSTIALTNTILVSHTVGISVAAGCTATLESTLWSGNGSDWGGAGTISHVHDYSGPPAFVDAAAGDYHLRPGSAALDQGVETGLISDIDLQPRPYLAPDLGADEYWPPGALKHVYLPLILRGSP